MAAGKWEFRIGLDGTVYAVHNSGAPNALFRYPVTHPAQDAILEARALRQHTQNKADTERLTGNMSKDYWNP
jgi:hypothetical protein